MLGTMRREAIRIRLERLWPSFRRSGADARRAGSVVVRRESIQHAPSNVLSENLYATLMEAGPIPFGELVTIVADRLYQDELRRGAGVLDIGLLGSRLFHEEVTRELRAGDGVFWDITNEKKT